MNEAELEKELAKETLKRDEAKATLRKHQDKVNELKKQLSAKKQERLKKEREKKMPVFRFSEEKLNKTPEMIY